LVKPVGEQCVELDTDKNRAKREKMAGVRQVAEEKNKFALSMLRRVRVMLEGREPDALRKVNRAFVLWNLFSFLHESERWGASRFIIREAQKVFLILYTQDLG
jgi:hypothetical protein